MDDGYAGLAKKLFWTIRTAVRPSSKAFTIFFCKIWGPASRYRTLLSRTAAWCAHNKIAVRAQHSDISLVGLLEEAYGSGGHLHTYLYSDVWAMLATSITKMNSKFSPVKIRSVRQTRMPCVKHCRSLPGRCPSGKLRCASRLISDASVAKEMTEAERFGRWDLQLYSLLCVKLEYIT